MKLYSIKYTGYGCSYHVIANSRKEAKGYIDSSNKSRLYPDVLDPIYNSYEEAMNANNYCYYWQERDIGEVLTTERS